MPIAQEDLKKIGFEQVKPFEDWQREMWCLNKSCYTVRVGYLQTGATPEHPHTCFLDGDKCSLVDVIQWMMADVKTTLDELEMGEDW